VARPALSASRSIEVIDFLAAFPERGFTLSEIARATKINVASCHAVLTALTHCGYLARNPNQKTYVLGPALVAIGQASLKSQPLVSHAAKAAEDLRRELGTPVLLSAVIGDEILAIISLADASGRTTGMRVGERRPLVAPVGAPFLAWSPEATIDAWIARHTAPRDETLVEAWRHTLALTRKRGYQVTLRSPNSPDIAALMAEMASGRRVPDYKDEVVRLINSLDRQLSQPETIVADQLYDILLIAAPIFDQNGEAAFNLCLGDFPEKLSGATITSYADRLVRTCLEIMRADRVQPWRREEAAGSELSAGR
jgi:DNA-binding IclR family transcriptional regulator